jgi:hypothetical protein
LGLHQGKELVSSLSSVEHPRTGSVDSDVDSHLLQHWKCVGKGEDIAQYPPLRFESWGSVEVEIVGLKREVDVKRFQRGEVGERCVAQSNIWIPQRLGDLVSLAVYGLSEDVQRETGKGIECSWVDTL